MNSLPDKISDYLKNELSITNVNSEPVSGGSINQAVKIISDKGDFFLKWNSSAPDDFFEKEADGLKRLQKAGTSLRVPRVIRFEPSVDGRAGFLLMEFVGAGKKGDSYEFGIGVATLHQNRNGQFGLETDNYIGSLPQRNTQHSKWTSFFIEERINPQLKMAVGSGKLEPEILKNRDRLAGSIKDLMPATQPSLLHGDLWGGNYLFDSNGRAVLVDPAVYYGHPEMDLAFSKMFGGFQPAFYEGYKSVTPLEPNFEERISIYNLYPLLVHVNLFGGHYINQCRSIFNQY